jgi:RimJ/RimL family protein N-acetyltransferase
VNLRPFTPDDYPAVIDLANAVEPEYPSTVEEWAHSDAHRESKCKWERWLAEDSSGLLGYGGFSQHAGSYHPQKFSVSVNVRPEHRGRVRERLAPHNPIRLHTDTREDREDAVRFVTSRGFTETMREWESRLDTTRFDPEPFAGSEERTRGAGIEIRSLRELESDPQRNAKLFELIHEIDHDVPSPEPPTRQDFATWERRFQSRPGLLPDAYFIAVDGDEYVGVSMVFHAKGAGYLDTGLTGVKRSHRRKGIALAMKLRVIDYAQQHGYPEIRTWNEVGNQGMLGINIRLGFVRQPAWVCYALDL